MSLFDRVFKKKNVFKKCKKGLWYNTMPRDFPINFVKRYESLFDFECPDDFKQGIYEEMLELTAVWLTMCPDDANAIFAGIIILGENYQDFTKQDEYANAYSLAHFGEAILPYRKTWFQLKALEIVNDDYYLKKFIGNAISSKESWFIENRKEIITALSQYVKNHSKDM